MAHVLNEESVEKKLRTVTNTQDSIQTLSLWIIHHKTNHAKIVELWMKVLKKTAQPSHRLTLLYLCNDVVQTCKRKKAFVYNTTFKEYLREAASLVRDQSVRGKVERIFNIWGERGVYDAEFVKSLHSILNGQNVKAFTGADKVKEEANKTPASQVNVTQVEGALEQPTEQDLEESARILAEFKPHEMIDQITTFLRQEAEIKLRASQLSHQKLDAASLEAVRQLKDRAVGNNFSSQFEDSCIKLEDLIKRQTSHMEDLRALLKTLNLSETFYEEQYREAKIVANAYKNFGARINNMKKKLDDLKKSLPEPDSPIPSPDVNAPSPISTPPDISRSDYSYSPASPVNYGQGLQQISWMYSETGSTSGTSVVNSVTQDSNSFQGSPSVEAPSPEGSPPDLNLDRSENATGSLDSRLASFFDRNQSDVSNPPVYTPQLPLSVVTTSRSKVGDDEGGTTPLDDETPTTPVQDEHLASPPKRDTPPKKENPIDFLSRLLSQTQKAPVKTETQSFLDSLTMLTMVNKKPDVDKLQPQPVTTTQPWTPWMSNSDKNNLSPSQQPLSPSSYGPSSSLPTSPKLFPPVLPMVPPPIPMPVPPPAPLNIGLNVPPPPPPFVLAQALAIDFSNPPPGFQQTSPGQKENWPDAHLNQNVDHTSSIRPAHSSVLKELVPADAMVAKSGPHLYQNSMEDVSDDEGSITLGSDDEATAEAKTEFGQKLKQKTCHGALKSHVFVPNPMRPNLMTLTVSDDLDEEDMIDDDTVMEEAPAWSDKSDQLGCRSRSRSHSREKDEHKKKDNWNNSDEEDSKRTESEGKSISSLSSIVKKIEPNTVRNTRDINMGEKSDERFDKYNYWGQMDRRFDRYNKRGYGGRGGYRPFRSNRGSRDSVQAYAQAYKEAYFQYNQAPFNPFFVGPPPMDPRRPGYGKY